MTKGFNSYDTGKVGAIFTVVSLVAYAIVLACVVYSLAGCVSYQERIKHSTMIQIQKFQEEQTLDENEEE